MTLNETRTHYINEYDYSHIHWRGFVKRLALRAASLADSRGVLNIGRDKFFKDALGNEYNPRYISHIITDCNRIERVSFATIGHSASARLVIVFDDEKISKSMEKKG